MSYRGVWKWLWRRKRKRVDAGEDVGSDEDEGMEGVRLPDVPQRIIWGRRSNLDGKDWVCELCEHMNHRSRHLFVDLPAFRCGKCNAQTRKDFRFSFGNLAANGLCPIGEILDQGKTDDCLLFSLTKATEMTSRIFELLLDSDVFVPTMDPYSLKDTFKSSRLADGIPAELINYKDDAAVKTMMELLKSIGVQDKEGHHTCKIGGVEEVHGFFEEIATEIAKGYPLVVDMMPGSGFEDLLYGEIYRCPFNNRTIPDERLNGVTTHIVILVGASRIGDIDYFYFLNSYGEEFCFRIRKDSEHEIGGIGKILADDICSPPYKLLRCVP